MELRIGNLRVYCDLEETPKRVVTGELLGLRESNRVVIGRGEKEL